MVRLFLELAPRPTALGFIVGPGTYRASGLLDGRVGRGGLGAGGWAWTEGWGPCSPPSAVLGACGPWEFSPASGLRLGDLYRSSFEGVSESFCCVQNVAVRGRSQTPSCHPPCNRTRAGPAAQAGRLRTRPRTRRLCRPPTSV